jgi:16S rRNA (guanine966-N2)-methyltransferase
MTRIVGGIWGGRRLVTPTGETTRPTSEKVRAALASSLYATGGLDGARVLDLYAGSGALGLELVSRGASSAVFVERDRAALTALRANVETLDSASLAAARPRAPRAGASHGGSPAAGPDPRPSLTVVAADVATVATRSDALGPFDIVVADPPYELSTEALVALFSGLARSGRLAPHADLVVERGVKSGEPDWPEPLEAVRSRRYGDTLLCYGRAP